MGHSYNIEWQNMSTEERSTMMKAIYALKKTMPPEEWKARQRKIEIEKQRRNYERRNADGKEKERQKAFRQTPRYKKYRQTYIKKSRTPEYKYKNLLNQGKSRGYNVGISYDYYLGILGNFKCFYCKKSFKKEAGHNLDRMNNEKGYEEGNVLPCCKDCNAVRQDVLTVEEMKVAMKAVLKYRKSLTSSRQDGEREI